MVFLNKQFGGSEEHVIALKTGFIDHLLGWTNKLCLNYPPSAVRHIITGKKDPIQESNGPVQARNVILVDT